MSSDTPNLSLFRRDSIKNLLKIFSKMFRGGGGGGGGIWVISIESRIREGAIFGSQLGKRFLVELGWDSSVRKFQVV